MGLIRMGPPVELILQLKDRFGLKSFVETGTYHGDTSAWAADYFQAVYTVEFFDPLYKQAVERFRESPNVHLIFGHSAEEVGNLVPKLDESAIFWLDSHWSGVNTYGEGDECPVLDELRAIVRSPHEHFILIDDARFFLSPPPKPHIPASWPSITNIIDVMRLGENNYAVFVNEDVIIAVPSRARDLVVEYTQGVNTEAWLAYGKEHATGTLERSTKLMGEALKLIARSAYRQMRRMAPNGSI